MSAILSGLRRIADNDLVCDLVQFTVIVTLVGVAALLLGDISLAVMAWRLGQ